MSASNVFGPIVTANAVERAVAALLSDYLPDYLRELERIEGYEPGQVALPAGVITTSEFAKWPEDQLPLVMILSPGIEGAPVPRSGNGTYEATWSITVAVIVGDVDQIESRRLAGTYAGAIRAAILQHKALRSSLHPDGFANYLTWKGETYSDIPFADTRGLDSARVVFDVGVDEVTIERAGPREPLREPQTDPGPAPKIHEVDVEVAPESVLA